MGRERAAESLGDLSICLERSLEVQEAELQGIGENHREQGHVNSEDAPAVPTCSQPKRLSLPGPYGLAHCRGETRCLTPTARVVSFGWQSQLLLTPVFNDRSLFARELLKSLHVGNVHIFPTSAARVNVLCFSLCCVVVGVDMHESTLTCIR
ncbi:hypothetical protein RRG08_063305 [Elysia crispata]|uniref:Uncharacterized protein n=1 Tax=Elysia crispata TaxID=231223 RepID=A0AAE0ZX56_9GAST|nr:hypothetical protein RRG08_063305 [Elysia crispata]